jgi:glycosyltransferase involved in cell wall biosynthesis
MVSCITVTKNRLIFLKKCINYYLKQDFSKKELVIGFYENDLETKEYLLSLDSTYKNENKISFVSLPENTTTGTARNIVIENCKGDFYCIWDDDDYYHENRISTQYNFLIQNNYLATALSSILIYSKRKDEVRLGYERTTGWEGSLMVHKSIFKNYDDLCIAEDTPLLVHLDNEKKLKLMFNPDLYVYYLHDSNTSSIRHLEDIFSYSYQLNPNKNKQIKERLGIF